MVDERGRDPFLRSLVDATESAAGLKASRITPGWSIPRKDAPFVFYGKDEYTFDRVLCERNDGVRLIAMGNDRGTLSGGECRTSAKRVRNAALDAKAGLARAMQVVRENIPDPDKAMRTFGWQWTEAPAPGGGTIYTFPLIAIGHGLLWADTVVVVDAQATRATFVQADLTLLCDPSWNLKTPLCSDRAKTLTAIATTLHRR